ncbi:MAG: single-stranded-DNA-specific exonuclease RecJ [Betaproteobacteria bacterium]|nr:single-stranded-DNA-specific exonuclease RecJ [Betaproteobacteria bacterium]
MTSTRLLTRDVPLEAARRLAAAGVHPVLARVFAARGIVEARALDLALTDLPEWRTMKGIEAAAARLAHAIRASEPVLIVADYDADGATACALGVLALRALGARVDFLVPNRFEFGYGLTPEIVALAATRAPTLIVTVDNGIASVDGVAEAAARGIEVLITDHHLPGERLPEPAIIVNPNQPGCAFPSKNLAGVGVMFYLLLALRATLRDQGWFNQRPEPKLAEYLDLVALGTVADVVKLDHVNRILVQQGLHRLRAGRARPGLRMLLAAAGREAARLSGFDLGFVLGPRLNAAGRLADMSLGINCLLAGDEDSALPMAMELDRLNRERKSLEADIHEEALASLEDLPANENYSLVLYRPEWHQGVVGIVASRLKDRYHRPAIVFAEAAPGELKGSGRSIRALHLRDALDRVSKLAPGLITRFGGHAAAAGLSLPTDALPRFAEYFEQATRELLSPADLARVVETDGSLAAGEITLQLAELLATPLWGQAYPAPAFVDEFRVLRQRPVGEKHLRLTLAREDKVFEAMLFRQREALPERIRAVYRPERNVYQGSARLQLVLEHWQAA